jgi:hypothetical protein
MAVNNPSSEPVAGLAKEYYRLVGNSDDHNCITAGLRSFAEALVDWLTRVFGGVVN